MTQGPTTFVLSIATIRACPETRLDPAHYARFDGGCEHTAAGWDDEARATVVTTTGKRYEVLLGGPIPIPEDEAAADVLTQTMLDVGHRTAERKGETLRRVKWHGGTVLWQPVADDVDLAEIDYGPEAFEAGRSHFENVGHRDAPLSGEWAGESIPEIASEFGIDLDDDQTASDFEAGFELAAEAAL
jgi:hypothetical protein